METFKTVLITGGNGNLGRLVAQQMYSKGIDVLCLDLPGTEHKNETNYKNIFLGDISDLDLLRLRPDWTSGIRASQTPNTTGWIKKSPLPGESDSKKLI